MASSKTFWVRCFEQGECALHELLWELSTVSTTCSTVGFVFKSRPIPEHLWSLLSVQRCSNSTALSSIWTVSAAVDSSFPNGVINSTSRKTPMNSSISMYWLASSSWSISLIFPVVISSPTFRSSKLLSILWEIYSALRRDIDIYNLCIMQQQRKHLPHHSTDDVLSRF